MNAESECEQWEQTESIVGYHTNNVKTHLMAYDFREICQEQHG